MAVFSVRAFNVELARVSKKNTTAMGLYACFIVIVLHK